MVRGRRTQRSSAYRRRVTRRPRRAQTSTTRALPSARSILSNVYRTVLQVIWDIASDAKADAANVHLDINSTTLFGTHSKTPPYETIYSGAFREFKVHRIDAHYVPFRAANRDGEYCFALADTGEISTQHLSTFYQAVGSPGSVVRKAWQAARLSWFPTESDDRNWHMFKDAHSWCVVGLSSVGFASDQNLNGKIIADIHISFRGKPDTFVADTDLLLDLAKCMCRKCIVRERREAIQLEQYRRDHPGTVDGFENLGLESPTQEVN